MLVARGTVTETGGATSHAAVVSRELGRPAVVGCGSGVTEALAGKLVTVDGNAGEVRDGILPLSAWSEDNTPELRKLAEIARRVSPLRAHAGGDYPRLERHSESAVRIALASGQSDVVSASPLLAMLEAIRLSEVS
jgi:pyruvate, orthophosphate dikinase